MILMPYTVTALAESDAQGTSGKNIVENATITLETLAGASVTMYDDINATNPETTKYTNTNGYKIIWIESGSYKLYVNGFLAYIEAALDSRPYGIAVESGIAWPNGTDLTDFASVFPWVNYTLDFSLPYTGVGLPPGLDTSDLSATLIYEGNLNGFGIFRLTDVATGDVWVKTWNNQTTQVDWQQIGNQVVIQQTTDIAVHDSMYSWWTKPNVIRYTDDAKDWTLHSFTSSNGDVGVMIHNHRDRNTRRYILDDSGRTPDDHNAGCICIGDGKVVAVYGGRSNNPSVAPTNECLICEWDIDKEPNPANVTKYYLDIGRDYPLMFQYDDDVILIVSQRGAPIPPSDPSYNKPSNPANTWTTGHAFTTNSWPIGSGSGSWSPKTPLTNYIIDDPNIMPAWMYTTARRNADDPSIIDMIWGFHPNPINQPLANIYKSQIRHVGGANPWRFYVNGAEVANLSTGVGLPIELADLELAYTAGVNEKTRLYDVKGDSFVFTSYTTDATVSTYQYGYKSGATWLDSYVAHCGDPFYKGQSFYFGGASISENGEVVTIAQNNLNAVEIINPDDSTGSVDVDGDWKFVDLRSNDSGATWNELQSYSVVDDNKGGLIHGRPQAEHASLYNIETDSTAVYQILGWVGQYSINSFNDFASATISLAPRPKWFTPQGYEFNCSLVASADNATNGDKQSIIGSESCILSERERQVIAASSDVQMTTRNSFAGGSRRVNFTGTGDASGSTDTWIMGAVGANRSTLAKNFSFIGGCSEIDFGIADTDGVVCNGAVASEDCSTGTNASFIFFGASRGSLINEDFGAFLGSDDCTASGGNFVTFAGSDDCSVSAISGGAGGGDHSFFGGSTGCIVNQTTSTNAGRVGFIGSLNGTSTASRTYQLGSNATTTGDTGAGALSADNCINNGDGSVIIGATRTRLDTDNAIAGGYNASGSALTSNRTWQINSTTGDMFIAGTLTQSHTFADTAKMVKNGEGSEIEAGYLLTLIGDQVYKARAGEPVDAIVAATPSFIHNDTPFSWQGRYKLDDFGRVVTVSKQHVKWEDLREKFILFKNYPSQTKFTEHESEVYAKLEGYSGLLENAPELPEWAVIYDELVPVENINFDPEVDNVKRSDRPDEWTIAGIDGFIRVRVDESITQSSVNTYARNRSNIYVEPGAIDGIGTFCENKTNIQVMRVEKEYDNGYGVALCYFKGSE